MVNIITNLGKIMQKLEENFACVIGEKAYVELGEFVDIQNYKIREIRSSGKTNASTKGYCWV